MILIARTSTAPFFQYRRFAIVRGCRSQTMAATERSRRDQCIYVSSVAKEAAMAVLIFLTILKNIYYLGHMDSGVGLPF